MSRWIICPDCSGDGSHSKHIGAITEEDRDRDWSQDEFDDYVAGAYDKSCDMCRGTGKVRTQGHVCPTCGNRDEESMQQEDPSGHWLMCVARNEDGDVCETEFAPDGPCDEAMKRQYREPPSYRYEY